MNARDMVISLADDTILWHDPDKEPYATVQVGDHAENHRIRSRNFRLWLTGRYYEQTGGAAPKQAFDDALHVLEAMAVHEGAQHEVALRVAGHEGRIYLDLADEEWRAAEITADRWNVIDDSPVKFIRTRRMRPLPIPEGGESIELLREFVNFETEGDFHLMVGWLVAAFRPGRPFPILVLNGEQGSAKSTTARVLRSLIDPNAASVRGMPHEERDLVAAAKNSWVLSFDNLSGIPPWFADALCRVATGGGLGGRELYTDYDEAVFEALRPSIINGIPDLAVRADLADRAIVITLPPISDDMRRSEAHFDDTFRSAQPEILGALLDAVSYALRQINSINLNRNPRMADFLQWTTAAEAGLGWCEGTFLEAYDANRMAAVEITIEGDPVALAVRALMAEKEEWRGSATELLSVLGTLEPVASDDRRTWPRAPNKLSDRLRRAAPALRKTGIQIRREREGGDSKKVIRITKVPKSTDRTARTDRNVPDGLSSDGMPRYTGDSAPLTTRLQAPEIASAGDTADTGDSFPNV